MKKFKTFGQRFCSYCGTNKMYYINFNGAPLGLRDCGNVDWCDGKTEAEVKQQYGQHLKPADIDFLEMDD